MKKYVAIWVLIGVLAVGEGWGQVIINQALRTGSLPTGWSQTNVSFTTAAGGYANITGSSGVLTTSSFNASAYASIEVAFNVAKFGSGTDGPITIQYSLNGGINWTTQGNSTIPTNSTYQSNTISISVTSATMVVRFISVSSPSAKRLRDVVITGIGTSPTPSIAISAPNLPAANTIAGATDVVLQRIDLAVTDADATLNGLTITTAGTYATTDLSNLRVRFSTDSILSTSDDTLSTKTTVLGPGPQVFPSFTSQTITSGSTGFLFITANIASGAVSGRTVQVSTILLDSVKFVSGTKTGSNPIPAGPIITISNVSGNSDILSNGGESVTISSLTNEALITTVAEGAPVWQFTIRDGGASSDSDVLPTILQNLTLTQGSGNAIDNWADAIQSCALFEGSTLVNNSPTVTSNQIQFTSLGFSVPDNGQRTLSLRLSLKPNINLTCCAGNGNLDGDDFQFQISGTNVSALTDGSSSLFAGFSAISSANGSNVFDVVATELQFSSQPTTILLDGSLSSIGVRATDAGGNVDRDFSDSLSLSNTKLVSGPLAVSPVNGESTFNNLTFNALGNDEVLSASAPGVTSGTSDTFNILTTGWEFTSVGSAQLLDFSTSVNNVINGPFTGTGFQPVPTSGQLSSRAWAVEGLSDGILNFNGTQTTGDFARGSSLGGVTTGGIYNFDVGSGARTLGIQPSGDFTPGSITLRCLNNTGNTVTRLTAAYKVFVRNDQGRSTSFNFSYSLDGVNFVSIPSLDLTTPEAATGGAWNENNRSTFIDNLSIPNQSFFYFRWDSDDVGGSGSRDELALDSISVTLNPGITTYFYNGTGALVQLTSWGENTDGTGANPPNFTNDFQNFIVSNGSGTINLSADLTISGLGSKLVLRDRDLTVATNTISGRLDIEDGRSVVFSNSVMPTIGSVGTNTTVTIEGLKVNSNFLSDPLGQNFVYDNLVIQNCTIPSLPAARTQRIRGNLTIDASSHLSLPNLTLRFIGSDTTEIIGDIDSLQTLSIDAGKVVNLGDHDLSIRSTFINNGTLILESGGSITQGSSNAFQTGSGTYRIRRQGFAGPRYNFMGSPVNNSSASVLGNPNFRYRYNEAVSIANFARWVQVPNASTLVNGQGYTSWNSGLVTFNGVINNGPITVSDITHTEISGDSLLDRGWNLVANPYPSAISAASFVTGNTNIDGTLYLWVHEPNTLNGGNEDYLIWNSLGPVTPPSHAGSLTFEGNIASGQGFFIRKTNPGNESISFTNAMRVRGNNNEFFRPAQFQGIKIKLAAFDSTVYNETLIAFMPGATDTVDRLYDGIKLQGNDNISLYSRMGNLPYAIQALDPLAQQPKVVPLGISLLQGKTLRWKANEIIGLDSGINAYLVDSLTQQSYLLTDTATVWTSPIPSGTHNHRFWLVIQPAVVAGLEAQDRVEEERKLLARVERGTLYGKVYGTKSAIIPAQIQFRDIQGRVLAESPLVLQENGEFQLRLPPLAGGLYLIHYVDSEGHFTSRCILETY